MLMHDFFCKNANDIKNTALANEVRRYKETETGVDKMCELMQKLANEAAEKANHVVFPNYSYSLR